ncbi:MAG: heme lyase CcmF/NrfE family subunit [Candidatus Rokubacteria bacterium]|nr:heme lyase CcmF/NrfE family subunit [Candidatus Rokubacteria bacterium]
MNATLGITSLWLGLIAAVAGGAAAGLGTQGMRGRSIAAAKTAVAVQLGAVTVAVAALEAALLGGDFSLRYVAFNTSRATPWFYRLSALWAALEGSLLLWEWLLAACTALVVLFHARAHARLMPGVLGVLFATSAFFLGVLSLTANPFETLPVAAADGRGLNPLLENPGMVFHPPALYLGYVAFSVPFAFAMAALLTGELGSAWIATTRRWTVAAWYALTIGIVLGAWWAYRVLGWGGYWAWDPVENASLLPWLTGTAFLHSVMIQERRDMLKVWNIALIALTFGLTLFGTFLTRSGIISSVHAFAASPLIGTAFLGFIAVTLVGAFGLIALRSDRLAAPAALESLVSRESAFVLNNVVLLAATFSVLFGTVYPLLSEALRGVKASVGAPYFNQVNFPLLVAVLALMGVGPLIAWRRASLDHLRRNFLLPAVAALGITALLVAAGIRQGQVVTIIALAAFVVGTLVHDLARGVRARRADAGGALPALARLFVRNHRRYGGFIVHLGVVVVFVGVAGTGGYGRQIEQTVAVGQSVNIGRYRVAFEGLRQAERGTHVAVVADFRVERDAAPAGRLAPAKLFYPQQEAPIARVAIRSTWREDLYLVLTDFARDGSAATVKAMVNPLLAWLWLGAGVMTLGTAWALIPDRRRTGP